MAEENEKKIQEEKKIEKVDKKKPTEASKKEEELKKEEKKETEVKEKPEEKKKEVKKPEKEKPKEEKKEKESKREEEAIANAKNFPISTKHSVAICKFIKGKTIENAIADLEKVIMQKKAVPMKGEIPHRKGKGMMSGRYPKKASQHFIRLLKSLSANASVNGLEDFIIVEAVANLASCPYGRFGRTRKKRTHVKIKVMEKENEKDNKKIF